MSIRNGTSSVADPQPSRPPEVAIGQQEEEEEVLGMDQPTMSSAAGIDWAQDHHALCVLEGAGRVLSERRSPSAASPTTRMAWVHCAESW
jgi:hypothetical protein